MSLPPGSAGTRGGFAGAFRVDGCVDWANRAAMPSLRLVTMEMPTGLRAGEVIELRVTSLSAARHQLYELERQLRSRHLDAVPVGTLLKDSGTPE